MRVQLRVAPSVALATTMLLACGADRSGHHAGEPTTPRDGARAGLVANAGLTLDPTPARWKQDSPVQVTSDDPAVGPLTAPVTVVMFTDLQCPYCAKVMPTVRELRARYGERLRVVWKDLPLDFHKNALPAATAARVAFLAKGNEAFWRVEERMFASQSQLSEEFYVKLLAEVGVAQEEYDRLRGAAEAFVKSTLEQAKRLGIQGTPNFMIDGEPLTGAQPLELTFEVLN